MLTLPDKNQVDALIAMGISIAAHAGAASLVAVLNTLETSFAVADSSQINVTPSSTTPVMVQRNLIAAAGTDAQYYLPAEDVLKVGLHTVIMSSFLCLLT